MHQNHHPHDPSDTARPLTWGLVLIAAVLAVFLRLLPYVPGCGWMFNVWAMGALALFAGARLRSWAAFAVPIVAMIASDLILRAFVPFSIQDRLLVYSAFLVYILLGRFLLRQSNSPWRIGGVTLLGSVLFFLITNFAVFAASTVDAATIPGGAAWCQMAESGKDWLVFRYANNGWGLLACYELALPFASKTFLSDLGFTALLFGLHAWLPRAGLVHSPMVVVPAPEERVS